MRSPTQYSYLPDPLESQTGGGGGGGGGGGPRRSNSMVWKNVESSPPSGQWHIFGLLGLANTHNSGTLV